jgi:hypothetical protein
MNNDESNDNDGDGDGDETMISERENESENMSAKKKERGGKGLETTPPPNKTGRGSPGPSDGFWKGQESSTVSMGRLYRVPRPFGRTGPEG